MSFLNVRQSVKSEYGSVIYAPEKTVQKLRELFYSECILEVKNIRNNEKHASKLKIAAVVEYLKSIDSDQFMARELMEMIEKRPGLTYQVTLPRIRHLMLAYNLPYRRLAEKAANAGETNMKYYRGAVA